MASVLSIATQVRNLISERSPAATNVTIPHIQGLIETGLELWAREAMNDPEKAELLRQDQTTGVVNGEADLTDLVDGTLAQISLRDLRTRTIYVIDGTDRKAARWLGSYDQAQNIRWPSGKFGVFLDNRKIYVNNESGLPGVFTGSLKFDVLTYPRYATEVPYELEGDFVVFLASLVVKEIGVDGPARAR